MTRVKMLPSSLETSKRTGANIRCKNYSILVSTIPLKFSETYTQFSSSTQSKTSPDKKSHKDKVFQQSTLLPTKDEKSTPEKPRQTHGNSSIIFHTYIHTARNISQREYILASAHPRGPDIIAHSHLAPEFAQCVETRVAWLSRLNCASCRYMVVRWLFVVSVGFFSFRDVIDLSGEAGFVCDCGRWFLYGIMEDREVIFDGLFESNEEKRLKLLFVGSF